MRDLIILGTGVHATEMAEIVGRVNCASPAWNLLGHVAHEAPGPGASFHGNPVLGTLDVLARYPQAMLVPDNEFPHDALAALPRDRFASLIDPTTFVSAAARIGAGCVVYPHGFIGVNARMGDFVFALAGTVINHDNVIEDRTVFASGVTLAGFVYVEAGCYLGQGCSVKQYVRIGQNSLIGMGAVVTKDVEPFSVMVGNPARKMRDNR